MSAALCTRAPSVRQLRFDVATRPFLVLFELTRACDLACRHCRAESVSRRDPEELTTEEVRSVLDDLVALGPPRPRVVFTGGDPLKRPDLADLVAHAASRGLSVAVSPAGTTRATHVSLATLRLAGARAVSFSLDAASPRVHDAFRGVDGSFRWTLDGCRAATQVGLRLQVNTTVTPSTVLELPALARLVAELGAALWSVFFVVPTGRAATAQGLSAAESEEVLTFLRDVSPWVPLKTTEAPAYRRIVLQGGAYRTGDSEGALLERLRARLEQDWPADLRGAPREKERQTRSGPRRPRPPLAVGDGRGVVFVSHRGDVQPSGFLPFAVGNVRATPLSRIYSTAPLLQALRDPGAYGGRCGRCELVELCGGSRAQAFARLGDPLAEDPTCVYEPLGTTGAAAVPGAAG